MNSTTMTIRMMSRMLGRVPTGICASLDRDMDGMPDEFTIPNCPISLLIMTMMVMGFHLDDLEPSMTRWG